MINVTLPTRLDHLKWMVGRAASPRDVFGRCFLRGITCNIAGSLNGALSGRAGRDIPRLGPDLGRQPDDLVADFTGVIGSSHGEALVSISGRVSMLPVSRPPLSRG